MKIMMRQLRLHTRPLYPEYIESVSSAGLVKDYAVIVHGPEEIDPDELALLSKVNWINLCGTTDNSGAALVEYAYSEFEESDADILITIDDDAVFTMPNLALHLIRQVISTTSRFGAMGPISDFYLFSRYKHCANAVLLDLKGRPLDVTMGDLAEASYSPIACQIYNREALFAIDWRPILNNCRWNYDPPVFMKIHEAGYQIKELYFPGFKHHYSNGKVTKKGNTAGGCMTPEAYLKQNARHLEFLQEFFKHSDPRYLKALTRAHKYRERKVFTFFNRKG